VSELQVEPLRPYGICGILWDQGESGSKVQGVSQSLVMSALIRGWRTAWAKPPAAYPGEAVSPAAELPFIYVQKPSGGGCAWDPQDPIASLRQEIVNFRKSARLVPP
jgi:sialate O-acetylesterase